MSIKYEPASEPLHIYVTWRTPWWGGEREELLEWIRSMSGLTVLYVPESGLDCLICALTVLYTP